MNSDGSNKKNISNSSWYEKKPMFSPDGTNIFINPGNIVMLKYFLLI